MAYTTTTSTYPVSVRLTDPFWTSTIAFKTSLSATGAPILNINAANTNVPLKERQRMVTVIYEVGELRGDGACLIGLDSCFIRRRLGTCTAIYPKVLSLPPWLANTLLLKRLKFTLGRNGRRTRTYVRMGSFSPRRLIDQITTERRPHYHSHKETA